MKFTLLVNLVCVAAALGGGTIESAAANTQIAEQAAAKAYRTTLAKKKRKPAAEPARLIYFTEESAMRALELEVSRRVGQKMTLADYPDEARRWNWTGITRIQVLLGTDGAMKGVSVFKTSGFRILDQQAVRVVSRIKPPYIPERLRGRELAVTIPIGFLPGR